MRKKKIRFIHYIEKARKQIEIGKQLKSNVIDFQRQYPNTNIEICRDENDIAKLLDLQRSIKHSIPTAHRPLDQASAYNIERDQAMERLAIAWCEKRLWRVKLEEHDGNMFFIRHGLIYTKRNLGILD